jgi:hypothetical protein
MPEGTINLSERAAQAAMHKDTLLSGTSVLGVLALLCLSELHTLLAATGDDAAPSTPHNPCRGRHMR